MSSPNRPQEDALEPDDDTVRPISRAGSFRALVRVLLVLLVTLGLAIPFILPVVLCCWNRRALAAVRTWTSRLWARLLCRVLGLRVLAEGSPPAGAALLAPNHLGYLDLVVLLSQSRTFFLSRADVQSWPGIGLVARLVGTLFIERSRRSDAGRAADEVETSLANGSKVVVFLEGKSSDGTCLLPFRSSLLAAAARTGVPCVPIAMRFEVSEDAPGPASKVIAWCDDTPFGEHAWRLCSIRRTTVHVRILPARTGDDRKALAKQLEGDVRGALEALRG